jgi:excisionase family DNA binding protein
MNTTLLAVADVAVRLAVKPRLVLSLIASGKLRAVNVSVRPGRPTWRIPPEAIAEFLTSNQATAPAPKTRRRRRMTSGVIQFYK